MAGELPGADVLDAAAFYAGTRRKVLPQGVLTKPGAGGGLQQIQLDRAGFLQGVWLAITGTLASAGGVTAPNAWLMASAIREVRLRPNAANDIYDTTGFAYKKLVDPFLGSMYYAAMGDTYNQGNTTPAAGSWKLDMYLPVAMNRRDPVGLFNLQNPTTTVNLSVYFEADATIATGIDSFTLTVQPYLDILDLFDPRVLPPQVYLHQIKDDYRSGSAGDIPYDPELGQKYLSVNHVLLNSTGAGTPIDTWTRFQSVVNGTDRWQDTNQEFQNMQYHMNYGSNRPTGVIVDDFLASTELGTLSGLDRDIFDTSDTTAWRHLITTSVAWQLATVRRQLVEFSAGG
jgi:hypothetical protein